MTKPLVRFTEVRRSASKLEISWYCYCHKGFRIVAAERVPDYLTLMRWVDVGHRLGDGKDKAKAHLDAWQKIVL